MAYQASCEDSLAEIPWTAAYSLFINRRRDRLKILHWDGTGFWIYYKLLEAGTFEVMASEDQCLKIDYHATGHVARRRLRGRRRASQTVSPGFLMEEPVASQRARVVRDPRARSISSGLLTPGVSV